MKYSFMSFSTPELSLGDMMAVAERYGYDGIEPRTDCGHAHGVEVGATPAQREEIGQRVSDSGVELACVATSLTYADPDKTDEMVRGTHERIDLAGDVGAPAIRVFGGSIPEGISREAAMDLLVESLGAVAEHASDRGVTVCMETHDAWCDPLHVAAVLQRVDHPAVAANWDVMHPVRMGYATVEASFEALRPWIRHLHVHDGLGKDVKLVPIGEGEIDHRPVVRRLLSVDYQGFLSGEWIGWEPFEIHLPRELATLRGYEQV